MEYPEHEKFAHPGLTAALLTALEVAFEGDEKNEKYGWYNGLLFSIESLNAEQAAATVTLGSSIASHADHILVTLRYVQAIFNKTAPEVDWESSWQQRGQPNESEWQQLRLELQREYLATRALIEGKPFWREQGLTQMLHNIAHTAYHASAIRQILLRHRE